MPFNRFIIPVAIPTFCNYSLHLEKYSVLFMFRTVFCFYRLFPNAFPAIFLPFLLLFRAQYVGNDVLLLFSASLHWSFCFAKPFPSVTFYCRLLMLPADVFVFFFCFLETLMVLFFKLLCGFFFKVLALGMCTFDCLWKLSFEKWLACWLAAQTQRAQDAERRTLDAGCRTQS